MARAAKQAAKRARSVDVKVLVLPHGDGLPLPVYQTAGAAGFDLMAAVEASVPLTIKRGAVARVPTGLTIELPDGYEAQVRPRSGLAAKEGVTVLNAPGTVDSDYRGELQVLLINHGPKSVVIERGMRIAQMVIAPVTRATLVRTHRVGATARGAGGFGSTGVAISKAKSTTRKRKGAAKR